MRLIQLGNILIALAILGIPAIITYFLIKKGIKRENPTWETLDKLQELEDRIRQLEERLNSIDLDDDETPLL